MRRFELTGPEVLVGGTSFQRLSQTILVRKGKLAVLADDDPRCSDLARSPYFREVGASDEAPAQTNPLTIPPNVETETPTPSADGAWRTMAMIVGNQYIRNRNRRMLIGAPRQCGNLPIYRVPAGF